MGSWRLPPLFSFCLQEERVFLSELMKAWAAFKQDEAVPQHYARY
jgi:hypothetical protein